MNIEVLRAKIVLIVDRDMSSFKKLHNWAGEEIAFENEFILGVAADQLGYVWR